MGLQEKQAWAAVNPTIQEAMGKLASIAGAKVAVAFDEASFATVSLIQGIPGYAVDQLVAGMEDLCSDDLAKEAVKSAVQKIEISHAAIDQFTMALNGSTLKVSGNFNGEGMCGIAYPHANDYKTFLTQSL